MEDIMPTEQNNEQTRIQIDHKWNEPNRKTEMKQRKNSANSESNGTPHLKIRYSPFASKQPNELCSVLTYI